jgi:hypothetical protein
VLQRTLPTGDGPAARGYQIDSVRSALDWTFSPRGDVAFAVAVVPLWTQSLLSVVGRALRWHRRALAWA